MKLTGSGIGRALVCAPSMVLPYSLEVREEATRGHHGHEFLMNVSLVGREMALQRAPEDMRPMLEALDLAALPVDPKAFAAEVAFAYDQRKDTARELGRGLNRDYSGASGMEICGSADVVGVTDSEVVVLDFKFGGWNVPPAAENWQLRFYALCAARAYGKARAVVGIIKLREDGSHWFDRAELDELDLDATAAEIRGLVDRSLDENEHIAKGGTPRTVRGAHCKYCPALPHCPAQTSLVREVGFASIDPGAPVITPENAPALLEKLEAVDRLRDMMWAALEAYATATPVQLPGGEVYGPCEVERETIEPMKGSAILAEKYGSKVGLEAVKQEPSMPWNRVELALKAWMLANPGNKLAQLKAEARELLRQGGALKVSTTTKVRRHKPEAQLKAGGDS